MTPSETPPHGPAHRRSPTPALVVGLVVTLGTVVAYSWYISEQISGLRRLQTELSDRNRRESLQLLRVQNDLNQLGLAMRDMLDTETRYPLSAWASQFERIRRDLDDALERQDAAAVTSQTPEQRQILVGAIRQVCNPTSSIATCATAGFGTSRSKRAWRSARTARRAPAWAWTWRTSTGLGAHRWP